MATTNEDMLDRQVAHSIGIIRYRNGVVRRVLRHLELAQRDLATELRQRLARIEERGFDLGARTTQRVAAMEAATSAILHEAYLAMGADLRSELRDAGLYEVDFQDRLLRGLVPGYTPVLPPTDVIRRIVTSAPVRGRLLRELLAQSERRAVARFNTQVRLGIIEGQTTPQILARARDPGLRVSANGMATLTRTAVTNVMTQARETFYAEQSDLVAGIMWVSTLDRRTSDICKRLDGQVFEPQIGPRPPAHLNCRSTTSPVLDGQSEVAGDRATEFGPVPAKVTYREWLARQSVAVQNEALGVTRARLFRRGGLSIDKFVDSSGRTFTLDELRLREGAAFDRAGL